MKPRILLIDVDAQNVNYLGNILKSAGYEVEGALGGKSAMECIHRDSYDLILLDVLIPELSSFEACAVVRNALKDKDTPIVFFDKKSDHESVVPEHESGGQDCIMKPFTSQDLLMSLNAQVSQKRSKDELTALNLELDSYVAGFEEKGLPLETRVAKPHYDLVNSFYRLFVNGFVGFGRTGSL